MALVKDINYFLTLVTEGFRGFRRGTVWLVLFGYFVVMSVLLYAFFNYLSPIFYPLAKGTSALTGAVAAERFFHYPGHFLYLPAVFGWGKVILAVFLDGLFLGTAAILLRQGLSGNRDAATRDKSLIHSWGHLILASFTFNLVIVGCGLFLPQLFGPLLAGYARRTMAFELIILPTIYCFVQAIFFLVLPRVAVYGESFFEAFSRSFSNFVRRPLTCFFLSAIILFFPILIATVANHPDIIIGKFYPELVLWILWVGLAADLVSNFLWMGASVRLLADSES